MPLALLQVARWLLLWLLIASVHFHDTFFLISSLHFQTSSFLKKIFLFFSTFALFCESFRKHHKVKVIRVPFVSPSIYPNKPADSAPKPSEASGGDQRNTEPPILRRRNSKVRLLGLKFQLSHLRSLSSVPVSSPTKWAHYLSMPP